VELDEDGAGPGRPRMIDGGSDGAMQGAAAAGRAAQHPILESMCGAHQDACTPLARPMVVLPRVDRGVADWVPIELDTDQLEAMMLADHPHTVAGSRRKARDLHHPSTRSTLPAPTLGYAWRMKVRRILGACALAALLGGCSSTAQPASTGSQPTQPTGSSEVRPSASAEPVTSGEVDVCRLLPLGDVQGQSPFTTPLLTAERQTVPGACLYSNWHDTTVPRPDPISISVAVTVFQSPADARTELSNRKDDALGIGITAVPVAGVGDAAEAFPGGDEVSVMAAVGSTVVQASMKGQWPDISDPQKVPAGTALVKLVISRLP
jgi:hypothetical protein